MAGLLTHLSFGLIGFLIIYFAFYKSKTKDRLIYGGVFALANIIPDLIDFGILSLKTGSISPQYLMRNPLFHNLAILGHTFSHWIILALIVLIVSFLLYKFGEISKKRFASIIIYAILVIIGVSIHLKLDSLIQETRWWV